MQSKYAVSQLPFNPADPCILHLDLNSCFASIEQQANPLLRGKPVAVAAYTSPLGCIIAPSVEAKRLGIKVGMRVRDGISIYRDLIVLSPDPWKYRVVHLKIKKLLDSFSSVVIAKSIDEFAVDFDYSYLGKTHIWESAMEIKNRIMKEVGDWLRVSIGIAPNRFLAKLASNLHKPDGLDEINKDNFYECFSNLKLPDLPYIKTRNTIRLNSVGINTVLDFYNAPLWKLKSAFLSVNSYYWYLRLHGYEIDNILFGRKSYGNSYALPKSFSEISDLSPIILKLVEKTSFRLRHAGYTALGVHLAINCRNGLFWHKGMKLRKELFDSMEIYKKMIMILQLCPYKHSVREIFVSVFDLKKHPGLQLNLFEDVLRKRHLVNSLDEINERWGNFVISPARMAMCDRNAVPDRIAFGGVKELEEFTLREESVI